jgi:hypothetical protein
MKTDLIGRLSAYARRDRAAVRKNAGKRGGMRAAGARLTELTPRALTGSEDEMERRLKAVFGNRDFREQIDAVRRRNATYWLACAGLFLMLLAAVAAQLFRGGGSIESVERPPYPADPLRVTAMAEAEYGDASVRRRVELTVQPRKPDDAEKAERLGDTARRLPGLILGQNESLSCVTSDLNLIESDAETGAAIAWVSENPSLMDADGKLNSVVARAGDRLNLSARLSLGNSYEVVEIKAVLGVPAGEGGMEDDVSDILSETVGAINASEDGNILELPVLDNNGVSFSWKEGASDLHIPEISALAVFVVFLFRSRYSWIDRKIKEAQRGMVRDFPEFTDRLLLMLNAGLVVSEALSRIAADYELRRGAGKPRQLYEELAAIRQRVENTNAPLAVELNMMAARSGVRELMRFASIVSDNIGKGSALADKLKAEGELVWKLRRKDAEETGRLAETKMILPMTLTLLTLVMITMAPAMMDMQ